MGTGASTCHGAEAPNGRMMDTHPEPNNESVRTRRSSRRSSGRSRKHSLSLPSFWPSSHSSENPADFPPHSHAPPKACVFALDGVLLDTRADVGAAAMAVLVEMVGHEVAERIDPSLFAMLQDENGSVSEASLSSLLVAAGIAVDDEGIEVDMCIERMRERLLAQSRYMQPCMGARSLIAHLEQHRTPLAGATNASTCTFALQRTGNERMLNAFPYIICADSPGITDPAPASDMHLEASRLMDTDPSECIAFESTYEGALAARRVGMRVVFVGAVAIAFQPGLVEAQIASLADFDPAKWGLTKTPKRKSFIECHSPKLPDLAKISTEILLGSADSAFRAYGESLGVVDIDDMDTSGSGRQRQRSTSYEMDRSGSSKQRRWSWGSVNSETVRERRHSKTMSECSDMTADTLDECLPNFGKEPCHEGSDIGPTCPRPSPTDTGDEQSSRRHSDPAGGAIAKVRKDAHKRPEELRDRRVSIKGLFLMRDFTPGALGDVSESSLLLRRSGNTPKTSPGGTPKGTVAATHFA
uniref:Uncharacterized protein n=1 Tax=Florenciella parvula TaxID=236787 RepID=A0A7S2CXM0_9STRA|mmetsp:Transcript_6711/g.13782  ORF Transcript_6711/g.13782 Transcript_6711/m.13782 type:complete len:527 (+) Transcript_6711:92-1672(+)